MYQSASHANINIWQLRQVLLMEPCVMNQAGIRHLFAINAVHVDRYLGVSIIRDIPHVLVRNHVDLIIMELHSEDESVFKGLRMVLHVRKIRPLIPVFICTALTNSQVLQQLRAMAVSGIFLKQDALSDFARCLRQGVGNNSQIVALLKEEANTVLLSDREIAVLECLFEGKSVTDTAQVFKRDIRTISAQKRSAMNKLGFRNDSELYIWGSELTRQSKASSKEIHHDRSFFR